MTYVFRFEALPQEPFEEKVLQYITDKDPVGLLRKCRKRQGNLTQGTRRLNWQLWTACYAGAFGIRRQPDLFATLLEDEYFAQRTYKADLNDVLRLALLIGTDAAAEGPTYKKACHIAARLQPLFDAAVEPMEVLARIEAAAGLNGLRAADEVEADGDEDPAASGRLGSSGRRAIDKAKRGHQGAKPPKAQPKQRTGTFDHFTRAAEEGLVILTVEVTNEMSDKVLNAACSMIVVERVGSGAHGQRMVGISVETDG